MFLPTHRSLLALVICIAMPAVGCTVSVSGSAGTKAEQPPPPPPPPPPPSTEAEAEAEADSDEGTSPPDKKSTATVQGDAVHIPGNIVFATGKATLDEDKMESTVEVLEQLKAFLEQNKQFTKLRIEGHTDDVGDDESNLKLSGERALTLKRWLVEHGIDASRLIAVGFGEKKPIADNSTAGGKAQNRRTEFHIAEIKGKKFLGRPIDGGGTVFEL